MSKVIVGDKKFSKNFFRMLFSVSLGFICIFTEFFFNFFSIFNFYFFLLSKIWSNQDFRIIKKSFLKDLCSTQKCGVFILVIQKKTEFIQLPKRPQKKERFISSLWIFF